jgi:hypothetical protein
MFLPHESDCGQHSGDPIEIYRGIGASNNHQSAQQWWSAYAISPTKVLKFVIHRDSIKFGSSRS